MAVSRRRSRASSVAAVADDSLFHVGQRLDALAADDDHAVFYFTRVATPQESVASQPPARRATTTTRRRRRRKPLLPRLLGLSAFYARAALLVAAAWAVAAFAVVATTAAMGATPAELRPDRTTLERQTSHELAALSGGAALGALLGGSLGDHYGRRHVLLVATAGGALALVLAGAVAWCHAALLVVRALQGAALGAQLVLFPIALGELAAQRRRGRVIVAALAGVPLGALLAIHAARRLAQAVGWRVFTAALLGGAHTVVLVALALFLRASPRFLAAIGRAEAALAVVQAVERAHGIDRNARVPTMPSSLFEPPAQLDDDDDDLSDDRHATRHRAPTLPLPAPSLSQQHRQQQQQQRRRRRTSAALTPRMVSLSASLRKRWRRVLFCAPYAMRSLGLTTLWVLVAGGLSTTIGAASRFTRDREVASAPALLSTFVAAAGALGLLGSAAVLDRCGRVAVFTLSLLVSSLATTLVGMQLFLKPEATALLGAACALLAFASVVALGAAVLWTLESYGVQIRATGMGLAFTGMGVGVFAGQWLAWAAWLSAAAVPFVLWGVAAAFLVLALVTWLCGVETRGLEDVDAVVMTDEPRSPTNRSGARSAFGASTVSGGLLDRESSDKLPAPPRRNTYHSKDATTHDADDDDAHTHASSQSYDIRRETRRTPPPTMATGASAGSDATTYIGSSGSRTSSARFSSVRLSSQRTLSSGHAGRSSSLSRQYASAPAVPGSSYRRRDGSLSASFRHGEGPRRSSPSTPSFVIRRSSLTRVSGHGAQASEGYVPRSRRTSGSRSGRSSSGRRSGNGSGLSATGSERREPQQYAERRVRLQDEAPRSSFGAARFSLSDLTTSLPSRLDPHSVREHLGRRSSEADRSTNSEDNNHVLMGIAPEHDVMSIDIDPFEDEDDHDAFVTSGGPGGVPILG